MERASAFPAHTCDRIMFGFLRFCFSGFILPPVFYYKLMDRRRAWTDPISGRPQRILEQLGLLFTFVFGCFFLVLSTYSFVVAIMEK